MKPLTLKSNKNLDQPLLKILHDAIALNQSYPEDALALNQSGIVKIGFLIHPDGIIEKVSLIKSSGVECLDSAAITAVRTLPPVVAARDYLKEVKYLAVEVMFQS